MQGSQADLEETACQGSQAEKDSQDYQGTLDKRYNKISLWICVVHVLYLLVQI